MATNQKTFPAHNKEENSSLQKISRKPDIFTLYFTSHLQACVASFGRLMRTPISTLMTLIVIAIALALPTGLFVLLENAKQVGQNLDDDAQVSLYLKMNVTSNAAQNLLKQIREEPGVAHAEYISPEQGLAQFQQQTNFESAISALNNNPLPGVIVVQPNTSLQTPEAITQLVQTLKQFTQVDEAQLDMQWIKRLYAIIDLSKHIVYAIGCLLGLGVLFIIGNTIHLSLQRYRREIEIFKLIGATDAFVRRPFLYTGVLFGLLGSLLAWILVMVLLWWLQTPVYKLSNLYGSHFQLQGLSLEPFVGLLLIGIILGLIGAWIAVGKHLRTY